MKELIERLREDAEWAEANIWEVPITLPDNLKEAADAIEKLQAMNDELEYALAGVMHSVDKWLEADDFEHDEVQRAAIMREKVLQIIENLEKQVKWIPVTERLPELHGDFITAIAFEDGDILIDISVWYGKCWETLSGEKCNVTHWMPLPEPPKGE